MKRNTFNVLFLVKKSRVARNGESPVFMRITVNGQRIETTINLNADPAKWNGLAEKLIGKDRKSLEINSRLDTIRLRVMEIYREFEFNGIVIDARKILNKYLGRSDESKMTLLSIFKDHNERCKKLAGKDMSPATVMRYETSYRHTEQFIRFNYKKDDFFLDEINHQFIKDYEFFLKTERNCNHNSATKYLKNFKKIIRIALANEWITKDPFANIKFTLDEVERDFLEEHEIYKIMNRKFEIQRLTVIRDAFIFCCMTNLDHKEQRITIRGKRIETKKMCPLLSSVV